MPPDVPAHPRSSASPAQRAAPWVPVFSPVRERSHSFGPEPLEIEMVEISAWAGQSWPTTRGAVGRFGEDLAAGLAEDLGLEILGRNWRCSFGELDLVAAGPTGTLRFVEVRTRSGPGFGSPAESVTPAKAARLRRLGMEWLARGSAEGAAGAPGRYYERLCVDVVSVRRSGPDSAAITWIWEAV